MLHSSEMILFGNWIQSIFVEYFCYTGLSRTCLLMFPQNFQRTIKKRIFGNNAGEIKQIHRNSDVRMCIFSRHQIIRPEDMEVREGSRYQNKWIFGKVPKGGGVIFNPNIYIADFGNFLSMKLIKRRIISGFRVCFFQQLYWY